MQSPPLRLLLHTGSSLIYALLIGWYLESTSPVQTAVYVRSQEPRQTRNLHLFWSLHESFFSFKSLRETATCLLWRVWHHGSGRLLFHAIGRAVGIFKYRLDWLAHSRFQQCRGTHFHSDITLSVAHTAGSAAEMRYKRPHGQDNRWNNLLQECWVCRGCAVNGAGSIHGYISGGFQSATRYQPRDCFCRGKYAFRAGEQPISRGEPKINKPYDKPKLCKTFLMFPKSILMCAGRRCVGSWSMFLSAGEVCLLNCPLFQLIPV